MRTSLAESLLAKIMGWEPDDISKERPLLQALANLKYDEYQQFSQGMRFIESLSQWLGQFDTNEEKKVAYDFFKSKLIFISSNQMSHLVNISFTTIIRPILMKKTATTLGLKETQINKIIISDEYKKCLRKSLFIGLSDGSHIDQLRRYAFLDNEQVLTTYYIDSDKIDDLGQELNKSINCEKFDTIFLIDDFTASGTSYARFDEKNQIKGKVLKFLNKLFDSSKQRDLRKIIDEEATIHIVFYVATNNAIDKIRNCINKYKSEINVKFDFSINVVQELNEQIKHEVLDSEFIDIIEKEKYFDNTIADIHYKKGLIDNKPYLGFGECGLPLIMYHNTPNNSLPILWFSGESEQKGLFPRITRHKE